MKETVSELTQLREQAIETDRQISVLKRHLYTAQQQLQRLIHQYNRARIAHLETAMEAGR